jgi:hypothetical protein
MRVLPSGIATAQTQRTVLILIPEGSGRAVTPEAASDDGWQRRSGHCGHCGGCHRHSCSCCPSHAVAFLRHRPRFRPIHVLFRSRRASHRPFRMVTADFPNNHRMVLTTANRHVDSTKPTRQSLGPEKRLDSQFRLLSFFSGLTGEGLVQVPVARRARTTGRGSGKRRPTSQRRWARPLPTDGYRSS